MLSRALFLAAAALLGCAPRAVATSPAAPAAAPAAGSPSPGELVDEIDRIIREHFHSTARLEEMDWKGAVARGREAVLRTPDEAARHAALREMVLSLKTSHTGYFPREDPAYWFLASLFEKHLEQSCPRDRFPGLPVTQESIGVFWKQSGGEWFVGGAYAKGPGEAAGLKPGDRVISADGKPFAPVTSFAGRAGVKVALEVQRLPGAAPLRVEVVPRRTRPHEEFRQASADSARVLERGGRKLAYIHLWVWTSLEVQQAVLDANAAANAAGADGFIFDIRDGWGGADPHYLSMFFRQAPVLEAVERDGTARTWDKQVRKPAALLVNGGTRSGKELVAFGVKKHRLATLVGERTAGAVTFGRPFCLADGAILWVAVMDARVDGERLEGRGVEPDVPVPFDFRYAAGADPQLERAMALLAGG